MARYSSSWPVSGLMAQWKCRPAPVEAKQDMQRMQRPISSSRPVRAFTMKSGSARVWRANSTTSAPPEAMTSSIMAGSVKAPTVATGVLTCFLISRAYLALQPSSQNMLGWVMTMASIC